MNRPNAAIGPCDEPSTSSSSEPELEVKEGRGGAHAIRRAAPDPAEKITSSASDDKGPEGDDPGVEDDGDNCNGLDYADDDITFRDLGVSEWLCGVLRDLRIDCPSEVQRACIPAALAGRDVVGCAATGSGKTAAFALPILQLLAADPVGIFALVLTPTRELAAQIADQFESLGVGSSVRVCLVIGGLDDQAQSRELSRRPHVVVATPGRLAELVRRHRDLADCFRPCRFLVLDEADRVLDATFEDDLATLLDVVPSQDRQMLLFSATMTQSIQELRTVLGAGSRGKRGRKRARRLAEQGAVPRGAADPGEAEAATSGRGDRPPALFFRGAAAPTLAHGLDERFLFVPARVKEVYLYHLLSSMDDRRGPLGHRVRSCLVFCGTTKSCRALELTLAELGIPLASLHSAKSQRERLAALTDFRGRRVPVLVATDVAGRGLDVPTVDLVIHADLPRLPSDYVHRCGRTARAGRGGRSLALVGQHEVALVHSIESVTGRRMEPLEGVNEEAAMKGITRVFAARRAAILALAEADDQGGVGAARAQARARARSRKGA